jgi:clan AA aspartic protease (TIGR02281 family)
LILLVANNRHSGSQYLGADLVDFDVTSWAKQEVTAEAAALCVTTILGVNLARKGVFKITRNSGLSPDGCKEMKHWQPLDDAAKTAGASWGLERCAVMQRTVLLALLLVCGAAQAESIPLIREHGTFVVPVVINDKVTLNFTIDSGASDVSIPADVFSTLTRTGTVTKSDFLDRQMYELADGSKQISQRFRIRSLRIGGLELRAVIASVAPSAGTLLLGQSFLSRLKSWSIDNDRQLLVFNGSTNRDAAPTAVRPELQSGTGIAQAPISSPPTAIAQHISPEREAQCHSFGGTDVQVSDCLREFEFEACMDWWLHQAEVPGYQELLTKLGGGTIRRNGRLVYDPPTLVQLANPAYATPYDSGVAAERARRFQSRPCGAMQVDHANEPYLQALQAFANGLFTYGDLSLIRARVIQVELAAHDTSR